jgi:hypothetical protein
MCGNQNYSSNGWEVKEKKRKGLVSTIPLKGRSSMTQDLSLGPTSSRFHHFPITSG